MGDFEMNFLLKLSGHTDSTQKRALQHGSFTYEKDTSDWSYQRSQRKVRLLGAALLGAGGLLCFALGWARQLTDYSGRFAVQLCSLQAGRSPFGFALPAL